MKELIETLQSGAPLVDPNSVPTWGFTNLQSFLPGFDAGKGAANATEPVGIALKDKCIVEGEIQVFFWVVMLLA